MVIDMSGVVNNEYASIDESNCVALFVRHHDVEVDIVANALF